MNAKKVIDRLKKLLRHRLGAKVPITVELLVWDNDTWEVIVQHSIVPSFDMYPERTRKYIQKCGGEEDGGRFEMTFHHSDKEARYCFVKCVWDKKRREGNYITQFCRRVRFK